MKLSKKDKKRLSEIINSLMVDVYMYCQDTDKKTWIEEKREDTSKLFNEFGVKLPNYETFAKEIGQ